MREELSVNTLEPDRALARRIALDGMVLRGTVGSTVHGLSNPGTDDRDEMGVCVEPASHVVGLRRFEHYVSRTQPEGHPSGPGDLDLTVYGLRKFCGLALKGSPTTLLLLFLEGEHLLHRTETGAELQALAPAFLSARTGRAFLGYLESQRRGLTGERHATRTRERSAEHGYDTKYAMHALRIGVQGVGAAGDGPHHAARSGAGPRAAAGGPLRHGPAGGGPRRRRRGRRAARGAHGDHGAAAGRRARADRRVPRRRARARLGGLTEDDRSGGRFPSHPRTCGNW